MTDENVSIENDDLPVEDELETLKARADLMGIKYHPNIGLETLREKITAATPPAPEPAAEGETATETKLRQKREATELLRVRVTCMDPKKKEWEGEIWTAGNAVAGTIKKFIHFDVEWHVPRIILTQMEEAMCQVFYQVTDPRTGAKSRKGKLVKAYAIEYLPQLTEQQLKELAQRQAMANGTAA